MRTTAVLFGLLCLTATAHADDAGRTPVTLAEALAAVPRAPAAAVGGYEIAAAEAGVDAAGAWPAPSLHAQTNRLTARVVAGITLPLPIFGTVGAAERTANAEMQVVRAQTELTRRELRHRVVQAWVELARTDADVTAASITAQQAAELEMIAKGRLSAGVGADVDVTVAGAARARAEIAVASAERAEDAASAILAGVLGWDPTRRLRADGPLVTTPTVAALETLRQRLAEHPEHALALRRLIAAQANVDETRVQRWPSLAIEGEVLLDDPTNEHKTDVMVGIAIELPLFSHIGDRVRMARALEDVQRARLAVTDTELGAGLVVAFRRWQAASDKLQAIERDVVPAQERAAALSATAYREGARDLASALQAERDLAAVRADRNAARADAAGAFADLQLAVGDEVGDAR